MQLSIIVINYNTFLLTCKCLSSIYKHTQNLDFEIILVDNASTECDAEHFKKKFPKIVLIKSPENLGFAKGNNLGLQYAKGKYILLLNSDIELVENSILVCLQKLQNNPEIGAVGPKLVYPNGSIQHVAGRFPSIQYELIEFFRLHKILGCKSLLGFYFDHNSEVYVDWIWGAFFLTKREIIQKLPQQKLPEDFFMYFEDVQWCYWIKKLGFKILFTPNTKAIHHLSASSKADKFKRKSKLLIENEKKFLIKHKGRLYTRILYLLRALKYFSLRKKQFRKIAYVYLFECFKN
jgi:GT2 family glycosyltransferase